MKMLNLYVSAVAMNTSFYFRFFYNYEKKVQPEYSLTFFEAFMMISEKSKKVPPRELTTKYIRLQKPLQKEL